MQGHPVHNSAKLHMRSADQCIVTLDNPESKLITTPSGHIQTIGVGQYYKATRVLQLKAGGTKQGLIPPLRV